MSELVLAILAGGLSRRYQKKNAEWRDKILAQVGNEPLLVDLIKRCKPIYDKRVISVHTISRKEDYEKILLKYDLQEEVEFIIDDKRSSFTGVMLGIGTTLRNLEGKAVQFLPSDRPFLPLSLLKSIEECKEGISIFLSNTGMIEPLLALYGSATYFPKEFEKLTLARADVLIRTSQKLKLYNINSILSSNDLSSQTFSNRNIQAEKNIDILQVHERDDFNIPSPITLSRSPCRTDVGLLNEKEPYDFVETLNDINHNYSAFLWSLYFKEVSKLSKENSQFLAKKSLKAEYLFWQENNLPFFALHALQDILFYFPEEKTQSIFQDIDELKKQLKIIPRTTD